MFSFHTSTSRGAARWVALLAAAALLLPATVWAEVGLPTAPAVPAETPGPGGDPSRVQAQTVGDGGIILACYLIATGHLRVVDTTNPQCVPGAETLIWWQQSAGVASDIVCTGCVGTGDLADAAVTAAKLAPNSVDGSRIADGQVGVIDLAFDPATQGELDAHKASADHDGRYFTEAELSDPGTINLAGNPLHWTKLKGVPGGFADGVDDTTGVASDVVCTGCIETTDLADAAVTAAKLGPNSVDGSRIADGAVAVPDLAFDPATQAELDALAAPGTINTASNPVDWTKLKGVPAGFADNVDDTGGTASDVVCSGCVGASDLASGAVSGGAGGIIADGTITTNDILNGTITLGDLGFNPATQVDAVPGIVDHTSIAIGTDGLPVVSYRDDTNGDLKVAKCGNASCSAGNTLATVDAAGSVGLQTSIAIGTDGLPVVSYYDASNADLKVARCGNASCSAGNTLATVDAAGDVGRFTSIAFGADGLPVVSYFDSTNAYLKVAKCTNPFCVSGWWRRG